MSAATDRYTTKNIYMHTLNGRPAMYQDGTYICYINNTNRVKFEDVFVTSLESIRRQQAWSKQWFEQNGFNDISDREYGYVRISCPDEIVEYV